MRIQTKNNTTKLYLLLAFLMPVVGMFVVMIIRGFLPFGQSSMLYSDMYHQYYPFFVSFRRALLSGESLLWNWDVGMGMDYLGLIAYYLASPLNLLSILVPESLTLEYFSLLAPLKLGLAGLFFAVFLKGVFRKNDLSIALFGSFYALCAWALGYHWNVMWLDTFALLPLVVLGTVALLKEKKFLLYTVSLFLSVLANYYIALFTCIFVLLVFFCYEICRWGGFRKFLSDLWRIALFSLLAIGMTAFLELPAFIALQTTQSSVNEFPEGFLLNIADSNTWAGLFDAMRQVAGNMNGGLAPNYKEWDALPNLYCGIISTVLAFFFLTCKQVKIRDRVCSLLILLFFNVSFILKQLDYIWHGFHFTNMIPYRFSYLYSFTLLYMAYRAYLLRRYFKLWQVLTAFALAIGIVLCFSGEKDLTFWVFNSVFLVIYLCVFLYPAVLPKLTASASWQEKRSISTLRRERRKLSGYFLLGIMGMELALNLVNFGVDFTGTVVSDYPRGTAYSQSMIAYMNERSARDPFFRSEVNRTQTLNDGALNNYHGISTFTSSANVSMTRFMQALGYGAKDTYNRYAYEEASPVSNLFLNLRYLLDRQGNMGENTYFDQVHSYGTVRLLENNAYLPLGFLVDSQILNVDFNTAYKELKDTNGNWNKLAFQNKLFRASTGTDTDVWKLIVGNHLAISATDVQLTATTQAGSCQYQTQETGGTVVYKYIANTTGYMCLDLYIGLYNAGYGARNKFSVWKNGIELYNDSYSLSQTLGAADVVPGDVIELHITCNSNEHGYISVHAGVLDEEAFREGYDILAESVLKLTSTTNTYLEGNISCDRNGVLYTSIPQNGNWSVLVDGMPAETVTIGDAMVGVLLSQGDHSITIRYYNPAFTIGCIISVGCLAIFTALCLILYKPKRKTRHGRFEKK